MREEMHILLSLLLYFKIFIYFKKFIIVRDLFTIDDTNRPTQGTLGGYILFGTVESPNPGICK